MSQHPNYTYRLPGSRSKSLPGWNRYTQLPYPDNPFQNDSNDRDEVIAEGKKAAAAQCHPPTSAGSMTSDDVAAIQAEEEHDEPASDFYGAHRVRARSSRTRERLRDLESAEKDGASPVAVPPAVHATTARSHEPRAHLWERPSRISRRVQAACYHKVHPSSRHAKFLYPLRFAQAFDHGHIDSPLRSPLREDPQPINSLSFISGMKTESTDGSFLHSLKLPRVPGERDNAGEDSGMESTWTRHRLLRDPKYTKNEARGQINKHANLLRRWKRRNRFPLRQGNLRDSSANSDGTYMSGRQRPRYREWDLGYADGLERGQKSPDLRRLFFIHIATVGLRQLLVAFAYLLYASLTEDRLDGAFLAFLGFNMLF